MRRTTTQAAAPSHPRARPSKTIPPDEGTAWALLNASNERAVLLDRKGIVLAINKALAASFHKSVPELVGRCLFDLIPEDLAGGRRAVIARVLRSGKPAYHEDVRDGRRVVAHLYPACDGKGTVERVAVFASDVTETVEAKRALNESEARHRALVEAIPAVIYAAALDEASTTLYVSPQIETLIGYTPEEYRKDPDIWRERLHPDDRDRVLAEVARVHETGEPLHVEYRMLTRDGRTIWVQDDAQSVADGMGRPVCIQGVMYDITARKEAEQALRALRLAVESSVAAIAVADLQGTVTYVNPATLRLWGYADEREVVGRPIWEFWHDRPRTAERVGQLYRTGVLVEQAKGLRPDGSVFDAHVSAAVIRDEAGSPVGMVGSFLDITGQKQREQEDLRHREQLRSLAAALSLAEDRERRRMAVALHDDVAQALALVKLKTDLLRQSGAAAAVATDLEQVSGLLDEASRSMWSAIFDLAPPALYEMGLGAALERLIVRVAEQYPETRFGFEADGAPEHLGEDTRAALFRSAREALVNVARHAKARNAKVSMQSTDGHVQVRIEDDGVGFDVARALSHVGTREGFGLVSIRERLTYLGGGLGIKSEPGRGTQVVLTVLQSADGGAGREAPRSP